MGLRGEGRRGGGGCVVGVVEQGVGQGRREESREGRA